MAQRHMVRQELHGLDLTTGAATTVYTTENGTQRFYPMFVTVVLNSVSVFVSVATVSVGITGATYIDIMPATALTSMTAANSYNTFSLLGTVLTSVPASTAIKVNVSIGAVATTMLATVIIHGFYD